MSTFFAPPFKYLSKIYYFNKIQTTYSEARTNGIYTIGGPLYKVSKKLVVPELVLKIEGFYQIHQIHAYGATVLSV